MNPWLHFGTTVHYSISARFRDHSTLKVDTYEKKLVNSFSHATIEEQLRMYVLNNDKEENG